MIGAFFYLTHSAKQLKVNGNSSLSFLYYELMALKILSILIYALVRTISLTYRYRFMGSQILTQLGEKKQNFIFSIWHQNLFQGIMAQTGKSFIVIVSRSKDAAPVAFTCNHLGHQVVRGSSRKGNRDKGGAAAKDEMIEILKKGFPGAVTVDGPKGPAKKVKAGIIDMARKSGAVIVPYAPRASSYWEFNSWDKFRLPKPFSKILVAYGEPIVIGEGDFKEWGEVIEKEMSQLEAKADEELTSWSSYSKSNFT